MSLSFPTDNSSGKRVNYFLPGEYDNVKQTYFNIGSNQFGGGFKVNPKKSNFIQEEKYMCSGSLKQKIIQTTWSIGL